ncbi:MAG: hypothetical protein LBE16_03240 [Clostridiales Family XIII bacterium]|jgi:hypothetical protein|nr:hypothetical protein [Clostridiales Family XIII bacterium]
MKPLISIETIPISIEYTTTRPQQKSSTSLQSAKLNVSKENDRVTITSNPIRIRLQDRFEQNVPRYYTATTEYAENGTLRMNVQFQDDPNAEGDALRYRAAGNGIDRMIDAAPQRTDTQAQPVSAMPFIGLKIDFDMAKLSETQSAAQSAETDFIPPDLEVEIIEYPKVIIKYVGGPIYFPRSADPNYEPSATEAHFKAMA